MSEVKLKPCPFCGSENVATAFANNRTGSPIFNTANEKAAVNRAVEAWNRRCSDGL